MADVADEREQPAPSPLLRALLLLGAGLIGFGMLAGIFQSFRTGGNLPAIRFSNLSDIQDLMDRQEYDEAISRLETTLELVGLNRHITHNMLGNALREKGRDAEAMDQFRAALELRPDFVEAHNNLAVALAVTGRYSESFQRFAQTLELAPGYDVARQNLSLALARYEQHLASVSPSAEELEILADARELLRRAAAAPTAAAAPPPLTSEDRALLDRAGRLASNFYAREFDALLAEFNESLASRMPPARIGAYQRQLSRELGRETEVVSESVVPTAIGHRYRRLAHFEAFEGVVEIVFEFDADSAVSDFRIRLGDPSGDEPGS